MKRSRVTTGSFLGVLSPLAVLTVIAGFAVWLAGALPARGVDVPFAERVITEDPDGTCQREGFANRPHSVFATDLDGDGDIDLLSASADDDKIAWYENDGGSPPTFTGRVITEDPDGFYGPQQGFADGAVSVFATDLDGDGDTDILSASRNDDKIAWYRNDGGSPPTFTKWVISTSVKRPLSVFATDVDGDGDTDVLSASFVENKIAWYENDGGRPPTFTERVISTDVGAVAFVFATDLDGDGDTDVLSSSLFRGGIAWYESDGGSPPTFTRRVILTTGVQIWSVFATDLDGDGDTDVLSATEDEDKIAWYENNGGSPPTFTERVISTAPIGPENVFATDVDGDGGTSTSSPRHTVTTRSPGTKTTAARPRPSPSG